MATSHQIKRMFRKFSFVGQMIFRSLLLEMFIWRLIIEQPKEVILFGDSVVFDNDGAKKREGSNVTYKNKKGFQPMQISWGPYVVDALFRAGDVHCNHGSDFIKSVGRLVKAIRRRYKDVPIILLTDSGFMDDQNFRFFEQRLGIHYVCAGKYITILNNMLTILVMMLFVLIDRHGLLSNLLIASNHGRHFAVVFLPLRKLRKMVNSYLILHNRIQ
ncbi:MAG: transposase [candidate division KSB1 bacterium]|nr:transposase [candidate division KSB1 bacterium]